MDKEMSKNQTIAEFFDPYNVEHLKAYRHLEKTSFWPENFLPTELKDESSCWQVELVAKIARAWLQAAEAGHIFGMPHFDQDLNSIHLEDERQV